VIFDPDGASCFSCSSGLIASRSGKPVRRSARGPRHVLGRLPEHQHASLQIRGGQGQSVSIVLEQHRTLLGRQLNRGGVIHFL